MTEAAVAGSRARNWLPRWPHVRSDYFESGWVLRFELFLAIPAMLAFALARPDLRGNGPLAFLAFVALGDAAATLYAHRAHP